MERVERMLEREFGRLVEGDDAGRVYVLLPGELDPPVVHAAAEGAVTVRVLVGAADFDRPGFADYLLQTHSRWVFGRFERNGRHLAVEHAMFADDVTSEQLGAVVMAVYESACEAARTLRAVGVLSAADP